jgi:hypothetical protein
MVIAGYVRKPWQQNSPFLNCVLKFICCGKIAEPIGSSLRQFDLLKATEKQTCLPECIVKLYHVVRSFVLLTGNEEFRIRQCKTIRPVPADIEKVLCRTLAKNRNGLVGGQESLMKRTELEGNDQLASHCRAQTHIERIMLWHVATSTLELNDGVAADRHPCVGGSNKRLEGKCKCNSNKELNDLEDGQSGEGTTCQNSGRTGSKEGSGSRRDLVDYRLVATMLSKYCAYLVFYKPKLLRVDSNSVRYMCKELLKEAKAADGGGEKAANGKQGPAHDSEVEDGGMVSRGRELAQVLLKSVLAHGSDDGNMLWKALAELWCELLVSMAPHGSIDAHQKELGKGGEFITHLWALLYHAGIDDKFSGSRARTPPLPLQRQPLRSEQPLLAPPLRVP